MIMNYTNTLKSTDARTMPPNASQVHAFMRNEKHIPREALPTDRADVRLMNSTVVGADVVCHAILSLKPLMADGTLEGLLVRVRQLVAVEMVHVSKGLPTHVAPVVLLHWFGGFLRDTLLLLLVVVVLVLVLVLHWGHNAGGRGRGGRSQDTSYSSNV